jgi:enoyl-CoA hydratase/carnithine racemase
VETLETHADDGVLLVRLTRPRRRNAINAAMLTELGEVLARARTDDAVRTLVFTGNDQAFSAGQDLKEDEPPTFTDDINRVFNTLADLPKPTVAAIDGWCIAGGLELALACDIRVAGDGAQIGDWHANINSIGGAGATVRLVRLLGPARAKELVFSGVALDAQAALAIGLVNHVYASAELVDKAVALARGLGVGNPVTVDYAKRSMNAAAYLPLAEALAYALQCQDKVRAALDETYTERFTGKGAGPTTDT